MKAGRAWIVLKAIFLCCMKYRPYMTAWITICVIGGVFEAIRTRNIVVVLLGLVFAFLPSVVKKIMLTISRIGGTNRYDEKLFGRGPKGRFADYITEYLENSLQNVETEERQDLTNGKSPDGERSDAREALTENQVLHKRENDFKRREILFGKEVFELIPDCVVTDIETTGLIYNKNSIIEIAAIKVVNGKVIGTYQTLIHRDKPLSNKISSLTGITTEMLRSCKKTLPEVMREYNEFIEELPLVGHNICSFDAKFINEAFSKCGLEPLKNRYIDTLQMSYQCFPDADNHKLVDLTRCAGIVPTGAHRALADCEMTLHLYAKMIDIAASILLKWSAKGKKADDTETIYPQYVKKLYPDEHCYEYHKKLIESDFLIPADTKTILNTLKVGELKEILSEYSLPVSGTKAVLIARVEENIGLTFLNLPIIYVPSQKGIDHKKRYVNGEEE